MGITIKKARLQLVLEEAVALAESDGDLPEIWLKRVERISSSPSRTYIAALGTALLAKAADERVDALAIKSKAGTNAYSMRGVVAVLAARASDYGYHLGVTGPEPLNNQPWFGSSRVDRITNLSAQVQPFHRDLVRYLSDLNRLSSDEALKALACFMRLRIAYNKEERAQETLLRTPARDSFEDLLDILETFVLNDPEGGRRGQALVAAVLDLAHDDVKLAAINDPRIFDVTVRGNRGDILGVEVKQKAVEESAIVHLAEEASRGGVSKVLFVGLAPDQRPLDRARAAHLAFQRHGVLAGIYEGVQELMTQVALQAPLALSDFVSALPKQYLARMQTHGVSQEGQQYWVDICSSLDP